MSTNKTMIKQLDIERPNAFLSADGRRAVLLHHFNEVAIWQIDSGLPPWRLGSFSFGLEIAGLSRDGNLLVCTGYGGVDTTLKLFDLTERPVEQDVVNRHTTPVTRVAISHDGRRAASIGGSSGKVDCKLWDVETCCVTNSFELDGIDNGLVLSGNGKVLLVPGHAGVIVIDCDAGKELFTLKDRWNAVAVSADGKRAISTFGGQFDSGGFSVWDVSSGNDLFSFQLGWYLVAEVGSMIE